MSNGIVQVSNGGLETVLDRAQFAAQCVYVGQCLIQCFHGVFGGAVGQGCCRKVHGERCCASRCVNVGFASWIDSDVGASCVGDRKSTRLNSSHYCASRMP